MLSEMFLFTPDELAEIRAESRKIPLYSSVKITAENGNEKAKNFIGTLDSLRKAHSGNHQIPRPMQADSSNDASMH